MTQILNPEKLNSQPGKIISLVPSITELLYDLGLEDNIVGITRYCIHPAKALKTKTIVGGVKGLNTDKIQNLNPDLIIANKHENDYEEVTHLTKTTSVYASDIRSLNDALEFIKDIGDLTNTSEKAHNLINKIKQEFNRLSKEAITTALYLVWKDPYIVASPETFISDIMQQAGFSNYLQKKQEKPYPELSIEEIQRLTPPVILLPSEPYTYTEKDREEMQKLFPNTKLLPVDGELFCWFGSRLQYAPEYFRRLSSKVKHK